MSNCLITPTIAASIFMTSLIRNAIAAENPRCTLIGCALRAGAVTIKLPFNRSRSKLLLARTPRLRSGLLAGFLLLAACGGDPVEPGKGAQLPAVVLASLIGNAPTSTDALLGTPLIINFWATWCRPCRDEMPSLELLSHRLAVHGVRVIGVAVDDDLNLAAEFARSHGLTFPIYAVGDKKQFQSLLRVKSLPETVLVTAEGAIAARIVGARDWNSAEGDRLLERMLDLRLDARH